MEFNLFKMLCFENTQVWGGYRALNKYVEWFLLAAEHNAAVLLEPEAEIHGVRLFQNRSAPSDVGEYSAVFMFNQWR